MLFSSFLKNRHSTREYQDKKVEKDKLDRLMCFGEKLEIKYNNDIKFILYEDGKKIYDNLKGLAGYSGIMINSPYYIGLQTNNEDKNSIIKAAYAMETLLTEVYQLDLGSCWINIMDVPYETKKILFDEKNKHINYIVAIGYAKKESKISKMTNSDGLKDEDIDYLNTIRSFSEKKYYVKDSTSSRLSVEEIVYDNEFGKPIDLNELEKRGLNELFYYVRYAPSNKNRQPWRFILKNNKVNLAILDPKDKNNLTDTGIMMYYFEEMGRSIALNSTWEFIEGDIESNDDITYSVLGEFKL